MKKARIESGAMTAGKNEIAAHIRALPDGEYFFITQAVGSAESEIQEVVEWFSNIPPDFVDIQKMQHQYNRMAAAIYRYTNDLSAAAFDEVGAKVAHEKQYILSKNALINSGVNVQSASAAAKGETIELMESAAISKAILEIQELKLKAAQGVQQALMMHLSLLKKERDTNELTKGDTFPTNR